MPMMRSDVPLSPVGRSAGNSARCDGSPHAAPHGGGVVYGAYPLRGGLSFAGARLVELLEQWAEGEAPHTSGGGGGGGAQVERGDFCRAVKAMGLRRAASAAAASAVPSP
eukprot:3607597-Prymnesium_polylepis.2